MRTRGFLLISILLSATLAEASYVKKPTLKNGEMAVFVEGNYKIFTTRNFESMTLSQNCFKGKTVACKAYEASKKKEPLPGPEKYSSFNPAGAYCRAHGALNLVATAARNQENDYCYFSDGSLVSSWMLYFKHYPKSTKLWK